MKTHPVDDLFREKLVQTSKTPSPAAWQKLAGAQETQRRKGTAFWWYGAAASTALLIVATYVLWPLNRQSSDKTVVSVDTKLSHKNSEDTGTPANQSPYEQPLKYHQEEKRSIAQVIKKERTRTTQPKFTNADHSAQQSGSLEVGTMSSEINEMEVAPIEKVALSSSEPKDDATVLPTAVLPVADRKLIVHIDVTEQDDEQRKEAKFAKVFRQLKNARAGEKVDWDEVGFNPQRVIARMDDRLRNEEQKLSDKYKQIKDKTKL